MSNEKTTSRRHPLDHSEDPWRISRRRLLATGTGVLAGALPVLGAVAGVVTEVAVEQLASGDDVSERQRRIAAILDRHGPELGSGR